MQTQKYYFRWGDEPTGYVTIWTYQDGSVSILSKDKVKDEDTKKLGYIFDCPFN